VAVAVPAGAVVVSIVGAVVVAIVVSIVVVVVGVVGTGAGIGWGLIMYEKAVGPSEVFVYLSRPEANWFAR